MNLNGSRLGPALFVWIVTFAVIVGLLTIPPHGATEGGCNAVSKASFDGPDCFGTHIEILGNGLLIGLVGLAAGTFLLVSRRRTHGAAAEPSA